MSVRSCLGRLGGSFPLSVAVSGSDGLSEGGKKLGGKERRKEIIDEKLKLVLFCVVGGREKKREMESWDKGKWKRVGKETISKLFKV